MAGGLRVRLGGRAKQSCCGCCPSLRLKNEPWERGRGWEMCLSSVELIGNSGLSCCVSALLRCAARRVGPPPAPYGPSAALCLPVVPRAWILSWVEMIQRLSKFCEIALALDTKEDNITFWRIFLLAGGILISSSEFSSSAFPGRSRREVSIQR